jgi:hypothetical protein
MTDQVDPQNVTDMLEEETEEEKQFQELQTHHLSTGKYTYVLYL